MLGGAVIKVPSWLERSESRTPWKTQAGLRDFPGLRQGSKVRLKMA